MARILASGLAQIPWLLMARDIFRMVDVLGSRLVCSSQVQLQLARILLAFNFFADFLVAIDYIADILMAIVYIANFLMAVIQLPDFLLATVVSSVFAGI